MGAFSRVFLLRGSTEVLQGFRAFRVLGPLESRVLGFRAFRVWGLGFLGPLGFWGLGFKACRVQAL